MTDYDDYYDAAMKDREPVIQGEHGGCILRYLDGELIRVEPGREGSPVKHIVWDAYAQREVGIYARPGFLYLSAATNPES